MASIDPYGIAYTYSTTAAHSRTRILYNPEEYPKPKKVKYKRFGDMLRNMDTGELIPIRKIKRS